MDLVNIVLCCVWMSAVQSCLFPTSITGVLCLRGSREVRNISELVTKCFSTVCTAPSEGVSVLKKRVFL